MELLSAVALALLLALAGVSGCDPTGVGGVSLLPGSPGASVDPGQCDLAGLAPVTGFTHGDATITITGGEQQTASLALDPDGTFMPRFDPCPGYAQAGWTDASHDWELTVLADNGFTDIPPSLTIDSYVGDAGRFVDGSACKITITDISPSGLTGQADCHGLRWVDEIEGQMDPDNASPLPGLPAFDAHITFQATP